jgi:hypothetical protein
MAIFVGMSKTGVQGLAILTVPMLAMTCPLFGLLGGFTTMIGNAAVLPFHSLYRALLAKQTNLQDTTLNVR